MSGQNLPLGKLPAPLLARLIEATPIRDPQVIMGPGIGLDCAIIEFGEKLLVLKSDPITFTTEEIGWYLVQINANDIATTGGQPRWLLVTLLLPEGKTTEESASKIFNQVVEAAEQIGVTVIGGHTEITFGLERPLAVGTLIGEVEKSKLVTPRGAHPGHRLLFTKGMAIETTAIAAREFSNRLAPFLDEIEIARAADYLRNPGISVLPDAQIALGAGEVSAMHDPTEGGLAAALWELAEACGHSLVIDRASIPISTLSNKICQALGIDPLSTISSGSLLLTAPLPDSDRIKNSLQDAGIQCTEIGRLEDGPPVVWLDEEQGRIKLSRPKRDEITRLFDR
jgi:hydrogenase expression/formation protein HypE